MPIPKHTNVAQLCRRCVICYEVWSPTWRFRLFHPAHILYFDPKSNTRFENLASGQVWNAGAVCLSACVSASLPFHTAPGVKQMSEGCFSPSLLSLSHVTKNKNTLSTPQRGGWQRKPDCNSDTIHLCATRNTMDTCPLKSRQCQRGVSFLEAMFCSQWRARTLNATGSPTGWR